MKKKLSFVFLLLGLCLCLVVDQYDYQEDQSLDLPSSSINTFLNFLPESTWKSGLSVYIERASNINGNFNRSIIDQNNKFLAENQCFQDLARRFYLSLARESAELGLERLKTISTTGELFKPSLFDWAGKGIYKTLKPGWLWNRALKFTDHKPNLAMKIIDLCSHDDTVETAGTISDTKWREVYRKKFEALTEEFLQKAKLLNDTHPFNNEAFKEYSSSLMRYDSLQTSVICPGQSIFIPQSLGEKADISLELKEEISKIQAPNKGGKHLPGKHYHILASASLACEIKSKGAYVAIPMLLRMGARLYRGMRMCDNLSGFSKHGKLFFAGHPGREYQDIVANLLKRFGSAKDDVTCNESTAVAEHSENCEYVVDLIGWEMLESLNSEIEADPLMRRVIAKYDAAQLWQEWYEPIEVKSLGKFCVNRPDQRPSFEFKNNNYANSFFPHTHNCANDWSKQRCKEALKIMNEWEIDFSWTEAQHETGAKFGLNNCTVQGSDSIESQACEILKNKDKTPR